MRGSLQLSDLKSFLPHSLCSLCFYIILSGALGAALGCNKSKEDAPGPSKHLSVLNWTNYIGASVVHGFEQEYGVSVKYDTYSSNEEMLEKLALGKASYDVVFPSDNTVREMIARRKLQPLVKSQLTNISNIDNKFLDLPFDPGNRFCVPYHWGMTGIGVNSMKISPAAVSWKSLWDESLKGRISFLNEPRAGLIPALKFLGFSINSTSQDEINQARDLMIKIKPLVKAYTNDRYGELLESGDVWIAQGYSGDILKLAKSRTAIKYVLPAEGSDIWVDNICILRTSQNTEEAHLFLNYLLRPEIAASTTNETGFATANREAMKFINESIRSNPAIFPPPEVMEKSEFNRDIGDAVELYEKAWDEIIHAPISQ